MQRVYILSQTEYSNILGIFTNIRQCRKFIGSLENQNELILHEMRLNEPLTRKEVTKMLTPSEAEIRNAIKQREVKEAKELELCLARERGDPIQKKKIQPQGVPDPEKKARKDRKYNKNKVNKELNSKAEKLEKKKGKGKILKTHGKPTVQMKIMTDVLI